MKIVGRNGFLGRQWTERLFDATQGEVFHGDWFESTWRDWTKYVPESVQIALASRSSFRIWNAGPEYNLARLIDRNDIVGARLSVFRMVDDVMDLGFTLSGKYVPSFKWRWRHFAGLSVFTSDLVRRVEALTSVGDAVDMLRLARDIELEIKSVLMDRFQPNCPSDAELSRYAHEIRSKITSSNVRDWADLDWSVDLGI